MKKLMITLGVLVLAGVLAAPVFAHRNGGWGWMHGQGQGDVMHEGRGYGDLTEDQRAEFEKLEDKFYADTAKLRNELFGKTDELDILLRSSEPDAAKARNLQKEISDLRGKLAQERIDFELKARNVVPGYFGRGYGRHMMGGRGLHMGGRGYGMGGRGGGGCW